MEKLLAIRGGHRCAITRLINQTEKKMLNNNDLRDYEFDVIIEALMKKQSLLQTLDSQILERTEVDNVKREIVDTDEYNLQLEITIKKLKELHSSSKSNTSQPMESGIIFSEEEMDVDTKSAQVCKERSTEQNQLHQWDTDVIVESCDEILLIDDESISVSAVDYLQCKQTVAVYCQQTKDGTRISKIMCVTTDKSYIFEIDKTPDIMNAGKLSAFFNSRKPPVKVFNGLDSKLCALFFEKFQIILDDTRIFDLKVAVDLMKEIGEGNMKDLKKTKYDPDYVPTSDDDSSINSLCLTFLAGYQYLGPISKKMKYYKKRLFEMVNADIDKGDLKKLRDQRKKAKHQQQRQSMSKVKTNINNDKDHIFSSVIID